MPSVVASSTVAEQVAALPPLSQLLGIDETEGRRTQKAALKGKGARKAGTAALPPVSTTASTASRTSRAVRPESAATNAGLPASPVAQTPTAENSATPLPTESAAAASSSVAVATPPSPTCFPGGLQEWRHVQTTLQLPLAYRGEDDINVTLRLLRSLSFFSSLLDHDLLTLAETMSLAEVPEAGTVVLRKRERFRPLPGSPTMTTAPSTFAAGRPLRSEDDDDDDGTAAVRPSWMIPAAELFHHFRAQMAHGDQPSLPVACLERDANACTSVEQRSPEETSSASRDASLARVSAASGAQAMMEETKTPLFHVPEEWDDDEADGDHHAKDPFVVVLLSGHCELRWPRQRGPAEAPNAPRYHAYKVQPGDAMGYALVWSALPDGARYVTSDTCTLLKVSADGHPRDIKERLNRACRRANDIVYKAQRTFLAEKLHVPLFTSDPDTAATHEKSATAKPTENAHRKKSSTAVVSDASGAVSPDTLLDMAARQLIPVRVPNETVLLQEGLSPATECALYFVVEGSCTVVRRLWAQDQLRLEARKAQLVKELTPSNGVKPVLPSMPSTASMEVAQLRPGDFCGELAYLRIDPDKATSIDAEWTSAYWHNTFIPASGRKEAAEEGEEPEVASSQHPHRQKLRSAGGDAASESTESRSLFRRHKATVITQRSSQLLVLLPSAAAQVLRGVVLDRLLEHANACPGYLALLMEYEKLYKWAIYKEKVLCEESKKTHVPLR